MKEYLNHEKEHNMSRILEMRYVDLEEELQLCQELLEWSTENDDSYGKAFALVYLGDYYLAIYNEENAGKNLLEAKEILDENPDWEDLHLRMYGFLGLYYDLAADEQNAIAFYLKGIVACEKLNDIDGECIILNNLAYAFQRHGCYEDAMTYYLKAYELQEDREEKPIIRTLLGNLVEVYLAMKKNKEARVYIKKCQSLCKDKNDFINDKNWCGYYSAVGEKEKAIEYAQKVFERKEKIDADRLTAFETYNMLCKNMIDIENGYYAREFLKAMEAMNYSGSLDRMKAFEETRIRYSLIFEPEENHEEAYQRFYVKNKQYRAKISETVVSAMKSKIYLHQLIEQAEVLQSEHTVLENEANVDELTGVYSRRFMETMMREEANNLEMENMGIVVLDIDYFKEYNDFYGHIKGDMVLKEIANCIKQECKDNIFPCRYGGDEFVCISKGLSDVEVEEYIKNVRTLLVNKKLSHKKSPCSKNVTLSIGYAIGEKGKKIELHLLFQLADQALYQSKRSGRNSFTRKRTDVL